MVPSFEATTIVQYAYAPVAVIAPPVSEVNLNPSPSRTPTLKKVPRSFPKYIDVPKGRRRRGRKKERYSMQ
jgi:hypothetical protein